MRDLLAQDVVGGQSDGVEIARFFQPRIERGDRIGSVRPKEAAPKVAASIAGDHRIKDVPPAIGAVDIAVAQGTAFQHAKLIEEEVRVIAAALKMPVPGGAFLITVGGAHGTVHVQHDELQPVAVMEPVNPLAIQIGQRRPVLSQGKRLGLEPPHLGSRGRLRTDSPATHDLTHDRIEGQPVSIVDIFVSGQPPIDRLPEQPVELVYGVLASAGVAQRRRRQTGQPQRVIELSHHQKAAVRTDLRPPELQPHASVEIHPITPV